MDRGIMFVSFGETFSSPLKYDCLDKCLSNDFKKVGSLCAIFISDSLATKRLELLVLSGNNFVLWCDVYREDYMQ